MSIDWSKAPEGFPLWLEGTNEEHRKHSGWYRNSGLVYEGSHGGQWRGCREGQFFTVHRNPGPTAWTGEGLPPGGTVCEMRRTDYVDVDWQRIEFLCAGSKKAFFRDREGHEWSRPLGDLKFRPIRTPEQIAEEEREAAHQELMHHIAGYMGRDNPHSADDGLAQYLLDHDYRKQSLP